MKIEATTIFIDTNILLSPLKIEKSIPFEELLLTLYPFKNSIVIPSHVFSEFYDNFESTFNSSKKEIQRAIEETSRSFDQIIKQLSILGHHNKITIELQKRKTISDVEESIDKRIRQLKADAKRIYDHIEEILSLQTNGDYSVKERYVLMAEYDARCRRSIAPGYKDSGKDNENDYGDLFIWQEILDFMHERAEDGSRDAIFITNDFKADWRGERSESQLQTEYGEYVFDGTFSVMSFGEFQELHRKQISSFVSKYKRLIKMIKKDTWGKDEFTVFLSLVKTMDLSLPFFLAMLSEELKKQLNILVQPFKTEILQLGIDFLSFSPRGNAVLRNAGLASLQKLMNCPISEMKKRVTSGE